MAKPVDKHSGQRPKFTTLDLGSGSLSVRVYSQLSGEIVEAHVTKTLAGAVLSQASSKPRPARAPQLAGVDREIRELRKVVDALAVRSLLQEQSHGVETLSDSGTTLLEAEIAEQLLDNPGEPNAALAAILAMR